MIALRTSGEARFWVLNLGSLVLALLLGLTLGVELEPFLWLLLLRPLLAALLTLLPPTSAGDLRPYTVGATLLCLGLVWLAGAFSTLSLVAVLALYCLVDPALDAMLVGRCPEPEWLGRTAQMAWLRSVGLALGMVSRSLILGRPDWSGPLYTGLLMVLACSLAVPESPDRKSLFPRRHGREVRSATLGDSLRALRRREAVGNLLVLFSVATLAGGALPLLLPVPLVTADLLSVWMLHSTIWWGLSLFCVLLALLLERVSWPRLAVPCYALLLLAGAAQMLGAPWPTLPYFVAVLAALSVLVAFRQAVAGQSEMDPCLRAAVPAWVWALGVVAGQTLSGPTLTASRLVGGLVVGAALVLTLSRWRPMVRVTSATVIENESDRRARGQGRHGDKTLDFTAAPTPVVERGRSRWPGKLWFMLTVRFPVTLTLAVLAGLLVAGSWHVRDHKQGWRQRAEGAWVRCQTELFLTSLKHRLEEEMLASNRVPTNWRTFVANHFQLDGRPLKDRDFWGTPLHFDVLPHEVRIVSAGEDKTLFSGDDLERSAHRPSGVR